MTDTETVTLYFNPNGTQGEYQWTCPKCGQVQPEWPEEGDFGLQTQVLCENCDSWFDWVFSRT